MVGGPGAGRYEGRAVAPAEPPLGPDQDSSSEILPSGDVLFRFNAFEDPDGRLTALLDEIFAYLNGAPNRNLVIDVRRNPGGDTRIAGDVIGRFFDRPYSTMSHSDLRVSPELKSYFMSFVPAAIRWLPIPYLHPWTQPLWLGDEGEEVRIEFDEVTPEGPQPVYRGEIVALSGPGFLAKLRTAGIMIVSSLLLCFLLSWLASAVGLATIVGAFAAGLILEEVHYHEFREKARLHQLIQPISTLFVPVLFVLMGIQVRLEAFSDTGMIGLALGLTVAAVIGKQACGWGVTEKGVDRASIGVGMIPRGEVGLIFVAIGKALNIVDGAIYSAIVFMVIFTTLMTPPLLKLTLARWERRERSS